MRYGARLIGAVLVLGAVVAGAPAQACSVPISVPIDDLLAALGGRLAPDHEWAHLEDVTGLVEYEVVATWDASGDFTAASASIPTRIWGEARLVARPVIRGGEDVGPTATTTSCSPSVAWQLGRRNYEGSGSRNPQPVVEGSLTNAQEAQLTTLLGAPRDVPPLAIDDAHPAAPQPSFPAASADSQQDSRVVPVAVALGLVAAIAAVVFVVRRRRV